jgi:UDP-GlcNAc:undecaprenyl-phosphate/decaprenyl-phosphate GlcNAc-1-phosphate transferase
MMVMFPLIVFLGLLWLKVSHLVPTGLNWLYLPALSFTLALPLTFLAIKLGHRLSIVDHPDNQRKIHKAPTPLTGGLAIAISFAFTILLNFHFSWEMKGILIGSFIVFVAGFLDDLFELSAKIRLALQLLASAVLIYFGVRITFIPDWLGGIYTESLITTLWLVGITNSMNFLDGMDGLASGISMIVSFFFAIFAIRTHQTYLAYLCLVLIGSCLGFFLYNFRLRRNAEIFLGDGGSNFLGFFLAAVAIMGNWGADNPADLITPAVIMGVLIFDMSLTTIIRIKTGKVRSFSEWIHFTGKDHFHHRLTDLGFSPKGAVILIFLTCLVSGFGALLMRRAEGFDSLFIILQYISFFVLIAFLMIYRRDADRPS